MSFFAHIIDGKQISTNILATLKAEVKKLHKQNITPKLGVIYVGGDKPSATYIRRKQEASESIGVAFELHQYDKDITEDQLKKEIIRIQKDTSLSGLIVQLPLPHHLDTMNIVNTIHPDLDVDCLGDTAIGRLVTRTNTLTPPTPAAVCAVVQSLDYPLQGKHVVIVGAGPLVGKPLSIMLVNQEATVTICNVHTPKLASYTKKADVLVSAVGKRNLITTKHVKRGSIVIDTGICFENKIMYGDTDFEKVKKKVAYITPTPGGIGPITVALLLKNTVTQALQKVKKQ